MACKVRRGGRLSLSPRLKQAVRGLRKTLLHMQQSFVGLENPHRIQYCFDARNFVRAKQISFAKRCEYGEEWFRAADFIAEILERMG